MSDVEQTGPVFSVDDLCMRAIELRGAVRELFGTGVHVLRERPVSGGSINAASVAYLSDGTAVFLKRNDAAHAGLFKEEARGLRALRSQQGPRVPEPLGLIFNDAEQILVLEYIEPGERSPGYAQSLGHQLACLHRSVRYGQSGFPADNHIGSTPQRNRWDGDWHRFFGQQRLQVQCRLAAERELADAEMVAAIEVIIARLTELLPQPDDGRPSLLHGDLWGGNAIVGSAGEPVLIDPAVYFGHREADLAMTELFGGFPPAFYESYNESWPLEPGYAERRDLYNLYHLLNHLNLFGGVYAAQCREIMRRFR